MRSRSLVRALFTLTTLVVVWLVSSPALASEAVAHLANKAPLCDPRGAITFAPPPQMQDLEVSLDTGMADDCTPSSPVEGRRADRGRAPAPIDASASREPVTSSFATHLAPPAGALVPAPEATRQGSRPGIRSTVDRPPR